MNILQLDPVAADDLPRASPAIQKRATVTAFALAGVLFALYPVIRPFSDEASLREPQPLRRPRGSSRTRSPWPRSHCWALDS
jgi:hypothetical protein